MTNYYFCDCGNQQHNISKHIQGGKELLPSNELVFSLPLDARCILLPGKYGTEIIKAEELVLTGFNFFYFF